MGGESVVTEGVEHLGDEVDVFFLGEAEIVYVAYSIQRRIRNSCNKSFKIDFCVPTRV